MMTDISVIHLHDYNIISKEITVQHGNVMIAEKMGKLQCGILQKNGEGLIITFENVKFVPGQCIKVICIGKPLEKEESIGNDGESIKLTKCFYP
jgi:hypothetical protein